MAALERQANMALIFKRWRFWLLMALAMPAATVRGQTALRWTCYRMADGLSEPGFNSVALTPQGRVIATSPKAALAAELDGYSVSNFPAPAGNRGRICASPAGQRWAVASQGLLELKDDGWRLHPVPEIAAALAAGFPVKGGAVPFVPVKQGCVLFLLPQGLMELTGENPEASHLLTLLEAAQTGIGSFSGMAVSPEGGLWISGALGVVKLNGPLRNLGPKAAWQEYFPPDALGAGHLNQPEPGVNGGIVLLAESKGSGEKMVLTFDGQNWEGRSAGSRNFFQAWSGPDGTWWGVTSESLFEWVAGRTNWVESGEISSGQISDAAVEPGGACWLATSDGLYRCSQPLWGKPESLGDLDQTVSCLTVDEEGSLYFIAGNQLHWLQNDRHRTAALPAVSESPPAAPELFPLKNGRLLVVLGQALFEFNASRGGLVLRPLPDHAPAVRALGRLLDGGVCLYEPGAAAFEVFDGARFQPLANPPPAGPEEAAGLSTLFAAGNGDLWLGGGPAVWRRHNGLWQRFASQDETTPEASVGFAELPDGKICCATREKLWEYDGENWLLLQAKFNHINGLAPSRDGGLWLASNGGVYRLGWGAWLDYGAAEGLPNGAICAVGANQRGQVWAATAHGVYRFHPENDPDPPKTQVRRLAEDDRGLTEKDTLNLLFDGRDKWNYTPKERLLFSHQLDQHGWSPFREATTFSFPNPAPGRHYFQVCAMDRNGNVDPFPATLDFTVITPWFREARLWIILLLGGGAAVFFAGVAWHRHRQLIRSYAAVEQKVAERTRELEVATRELLHSQKMNALGTLAAGIAHDFNNILSIIKGSAQIIGDHPDEPEKIRTRVERINTVVQQGAEIVDAMLGFSRGSEAPATRCDLNAVVADTLKLLGDRFLRETVVTFERAENLPELSVSREFIQQILINLIFNAAEAMSGRKKIILSTRRAEQLPAEIFLSPAAGAAFVLISVRDQGGGIAPEIKARIFEPFFTTKALSTRRGTGLGLSMVYELAKKMGAGLAVESVVGEGSEFTLILPVPPMESAGPEAKPRPDRLINPTRS
jgi:signal transduction histidine kinase